MSDQSTPSSAEVEWREVPGWPGYRASSDGRVETQWIRDTNRGGRRGCLPTCRQNEWRPAPIQKNFYGYFVVRIPRTASPTGKETKVAVHIFVCLAFHGLPEPGQEVRHFPDNNRTNNRPENLSWATHAENLADRKFHGTLRHGIRCNFARFTEREIRSMRRMREKGFTTTAIANKFKTDQGTVSKIVRRIRWAHLD